MNQKRIQDYGYQIGTMSKGPLNKITDVAGVSVGHTTIRTQELNTGVTIVIPAPGNLFKNKLTAAGYVHNGFGKTCGLMQLQELGSLETPIALTNTLNIGLVHDALVTHTLRMCEQEGIDVRSVNPVVGECNDGRLSRIALRPVKAEHIFSTIAQASVNFEEGSIGAGTGTICFGLKGGIGSASRHLELFGQTYTIGVLVQSNYGSTEDLMIDGYPVGKHIAAELKKRKAEKTEVDAGSVMTILATDLPVSSRQLYRILRRCGVGLARTGSYLGHGSGEVMLGFTTANRIPYDADSLLSQKVIPEEKLNLAFRAAAECTEEAVLNSMVTADTAIGYDGLKIWSLREFL